MGRPAAYSEKQMVDAAAALVAERGLDAFTMEALGGAIGAPMGSIYYRFASRDSLLASVWLDEVERFQGFWVGAASRAEHPGELAWATVEYARKQPARARLLVRHRPDEWLGPDVPKDLQRRARHLNDEIPGALRALSVRWIGRATSRQIATLRFAVVDIPLAAVRPYLEKDAAVPSWLTTTVASAADAAWEAGCGT